MKIFALSSVMLACLAAAPAIAQETSSAQVAAGREAALKICANCHVVAKDQAEPALKPPAPSFAQIAQRPTTTPEALKNFLANPHGESRRKSRMPAFMLSARQIDEVVAYLLSLK